MTRHLAALALVALVSAVSLGWVHPAAAQAETGRLPITDAAFSGTLNGNPATGTFTGEIANAQVSTQGEQLMLSGTIAGTLVTDAGQLPVPGQPFNSTIVVNTGTTCDRLSLYLGRITLTAPVADIDLVPVQLAVPADAANGDTLSPLLCGISKTLETPIGALPAIADQLNQVLRLYVA